MQHFVITKFCKLYGHLAADERPLHQRLAAAHRLPDLVNGIWYYVLGNSTAPKHSRSRTADLERLEGPRGINLVDKGMVARLHLKLEGSFKGCYLPVPQQCCGLPFAAA
jgi:hypothetical protein